MINIGDDIPSLVMPTLQCPSCDEFTVNYSYDTTWECENPWCLAGFDPETGQAWRDTWKVPRPRKPARPYKYPEEVAAEYAREQVPKEELAKERLSGLLFSFEEPDEKAIVTFG